MSNIKRYRTFPKLIDMFLLSLEPCVSCIILYHSYVVSVDRLINYTNWTFLVAVVPIHSAILFRALGQCVRCIEFKMCSRPKEMQVEQFQ